MTMTVIGGVSDAMSDVLFLVRMRGESICANDFSAPWSVKFHGPFAHFHIVERGSAWVVTDDAPPLRAEAGDLILLPLGAGHSLGDDIDRPAIPIEEAIADHATREGSVLKFGGGGAQTHVVCGQFSFAGVLAPKLLSILPPLIHIRSEPGRPLEWLRITTHFLVEETRHPKPGSAIMISRLLDLLFVQAIRDWGSKNANLLGWLSGVRDAQIGKSLSAIHDHPARTWTVGSACRHRRAVALGLCRPVCQYRRQDPAQICHHLEA